MRRLRPGERQPKDKALRSWPWKYLRKHHGLKRLDQYFIQPGENEFGKFLIYSLSEESRPVVAEVLEELDKQEYLDTLYVEKGLYSTLIIGRWKQG